MPLSNDDDKIRLPTLDPDIVADDDKLWAAIEDSVLSDRSILRMARKVVLRQRDLRRLIEPAAFDVYLDVEQLSNARYERVIVKLVRWTWAQARRDGAGR